MLQSGRGGNFAIKNLGGLTVTWALIISLPPGFYNKTVIISYHRATRIFKGRGLIGEKGSKNIVLVDIVLNNRNTA